jgi:hypothetical protein
VLLEGPLVGEGFKIFADLNEPQTFVIINMTVLPLVRILSEIFESWNFLRISSKKSEVAWLKVKL